MPNFTLAVNAVMLTQASGQGGLGLQTILGPGSPNPFTPESSLPIRLAQEDAIAVSSGDPVAITSVALGLAAKYALKQGQFVTAAGLYAGSFIFWAIQHSHNSHGADLPDEQISVIGGGGVVAISPPMWLRDP